MARNEDHNAVDPQAIRDKHFAETGVDAENNAPRNVEFDEAGNIVSGSEG